MTVSQWLKINKLDYIHSDFKIVDKRKHVILNDRLDYLSVRSDEYNANWKKKCRGKQILTTWETKKGIVLQIDTYI